MFNVRRRLMSKNRQLPNDLRLKVFMKLGLRPSIFVVVIVFAGLITTGMAMHSSPVISIQESPSAHGQRVAADEKEIKQSATSTAVTIAPRIGVGEAVNLAKEALTNATNPAELTSLGCCLMNGTEGYPIVPDIAYCLLKKAAKLGGVQAMVCIGYCYYNRIGIDKLCKYEQDNKESAGEKYAQDLAKANKAARAYYALAARHGGKDVVVQYLKLLEQRKFGFYAQRCVNCNGYFIKNDGSPLKEFVQLRDGLMVHVTCPADGPLIKKSST
jgi:hypothetical protein